MVLRGWMTSVLSCDLCYLKMFFCVSSRRRHTMLVSDWSSDVCSSDLGGFEGDLNFKLIEKFPWGTPFAEFQNFEAALRGSRATQDDETWCADSRGQIGRASCRERV